MCLLSAQHTGKFSIFHYCQDYICLKFASSGWQHHFHFHKQCPLDLHISKELAIKKWQSYLEEIVQFLHLYLTPAIVNGVAPQSSFALMSTSAKRNAKF